MSNVELQDNPGGSQFERGWTDFDANKEGFPQGLKHTISYIREKHKNIQHIAVWHAMVCGSYISSLYTQAERVRKLGYWGAISPEGEIARKYKTRKVSAPVGIPPRPRTLTVVDADDVQQMYKDFYK